MRPHELPSPLNEYRAFPLPAQNPGLAFGMGPFLPGHSMRNDTKLLGLQSRNARLATMDADMDCEFPRVSFDVAAVQSCSARLEYRCLGLVRASSECVFLGIPWISAS